MYKLMIKAQMLVNNSVTDEDPDLLKKLAEFFNQTVLRWTLWGVTCLFTILVIQAGVKMGMAKSPEEKQAAKGKLLGLVIGFGICLIASSIVTMLAGVFDGIND